MKVTYTFRHMDASDRAKAHTKDKLERLARFEDREMSVDVVFTTEKHEVSAEFKVAGAHGTFMVSETRPDLFEAIDVAVDKLDQVLSRDKDRRKHHKGNQGTTPQDLG
jgi:ribosomal subunit interface protein